MSSATASVSSYTLPHLHFRGTNYECGFQMGREFKRRIDLYLESFTEFKVLINPFLNTANGKKVAENFLSSIKNECPWYLDEIRGLADGSANSFETILAINLRVELVQLASMQMESSSSSAAAAAAAAKNQIDRECCDIHLINQNGCFMAHNEDSSPCVSETAYLVSCNIKPSDYDGKMSPEESFTCYCYPAHLAGNAFGFNSHGFCFGLNANYSNCVITQHLPRQIINRMLMACKSLKEIENVLRKPISYGFSLNLGFCGDNYSVLDSDWTSEYYFSSSVKSTPSMLTPDSPITFNYEVKAQSGSSSNLVSKRCTVSDAQFKQQFGLTNSSSLFSVGFLYHTNNYMRIQDEQVEWRIRSSLHRNKKIESFEVPKTLEEVLIILSDSSDVEYPIYRTPRPTDNSITAATAVFDLKNQTLHVYLNRPTDRDLKHAIKLLI